MSGVVIDLRIGISGWRYPSWRGDWYPVGLPQRRELEFSAHRLNSVEINGSFYSLQRPASYLRWYDKTPPSFLFAVKGPRFITYMKRLTDVDGALANFFASGVLALRDKLGPVLWQLPERHDFNPGQLEHFFSLLPRTTSDALTLARRYDDRLDGRAWLDEQRDRPIRYALEARHRGFATQDAAAVLRNHDIGFVVADTAGRWPQNREVTADIVYVRLHGADELYTSGYTTEQLTRWAADITAWQATGRDVFVYFDNDADGRAPFDAIQLTALLTEPCDSPQDNRPAG